MMIIRTLALTIAANSATAAQLYHGGPVPPQANDAAALADHALLEKRAAAGELIMSSEYYTSRRQLLSNIPKSSSSPKNHLHSQKFSVAPCLTTEACKAEALSAISYRHTPDKHSKKDCRRGQKFPPR